MRNLAAVCVVVGLAGAISCGSDPPDTLTCEWLAQVDNCWKTTVRAAGNCLPPEADRGALSANNATCTHPNGQIVTFNPPPVLTSDEDPITNFTVSSANGGTCVSWQEMGDSGFTLTVDGVGSFRESTSGFAMNVTCPDGTSYHAGNALNLLNCDTGLFGLPGQAYSWSDTSVSYSFIGADPSVPVFDCTAATP